MSASVMSADFKETKRFASGAIATFYAKDQRVERDGPPPSKNDIRSYIEWMNQLMQRAADETNQRIMRVYAHSKSRFETWLYSPGGTPTLCTGKETQP